MTTTKERLAEALEDAGAPEKMIQFARRGGYDDYESDSATPICDLVLDAKKAGLDDIVNRAIKGEFDGTKEESDAWYQREGKALLRKSC